MAKLLATDDDGNSYALFRRFGLICVIWNRPIFSAIQADAGWRPYACNSAASYDNCNVGHVHFLFSTPGAMMRTSWWQMTPATTSPARIEGCPRRRGLTPPIPRRRPVCATSSCSTHCAHADRPQLDAAEHSRMHAEHSERFDSIDGKLGQLTLGMHNGRIAVAAASWTTRDVGRRCRRAHLRWRGRATATQPSVSVASTAVPIDGNRVD